MKKFLLVLSALFLVACNLQEGVKETGDAANTAAENIIEGVKQAPKAIGDAANKLEKDIKD